MIEGGSGRIILVGDDDGNLLIMEKEILEDCLGYRVGTFQDPRELLAEFLENPQLVLGVVSDYDYGDSMTGTALLVEIVSHCNKIRQRLPLIVMVTGNDNGAIQGVEKLREFGIPIIRKPNVMNPLIELFTTAT